MASRTALRAGVALRHLVDHVSHGSGLVLAAMNAAGVTLAHVLLLDHVARGRATSPSELADAMRVSLSAVSQTIDRLVAQGWLDRTEDPRDRRRKTLAVTPTGRALLTKIERARDEDYARGLEAASPALLASLADALANVTAALTTRKAAS